MKTSKNIGQNAGIKTSGESDAKAEAKPQVLDTHKKQMKILEEHFRDRIKMKSTQFSAVGKVSQAGTTSYQAEQTDNQKLYRIKLSTTPESIMCNVNEYVMAPFYRRYLYDRAPLVDFVHDERSVGNFSIRSRYLHQSETLYSFPEKQNKTTREALKGVSGFEKLMASIAICAESDNHSWNIMVMNMGTDESPYYVYAKVDHGYSSHNFYSSPAVMLADLHYFCMVRNFGEKVIDGRLYEAALSSMLQLNDFDAEAIIQGRLYFLKKTGFDPSICPYKTRLDMNLKTDIILELLTEAEQQQKGKLLEQMEEMSKNVRRAINIEEQTTLENHRNHLQQQYQAILDKAYCELEKHYVTQLKQQRDVARQVRDWMIIVNHIDRPDRDIWLSSGKWLDELKDQNPLTWAKERGYTLEGRTPDEYKEQGGFVINQQEKNKNAFLYAIKTGDKATYKPLIKSRTGLEAVDEKGDNAMLLAARKGDMEAVLLLMQAGINLNHRNKKNETALQIIMNAEMRYWGLIDMMTRKGAGLNVTLNIPRLVKAAYLEDKPDIIALLAKHQFMLPPQKEISELLKQASYLRGTVITEAILLLNADPQSKGLLNALFQAVLQDFSGDNSFGSPRLYLSQIILNLSDLGADTSRVDGKGMTSLMHVSRGGHARLVNKLLESKPDMNVTDKAGNTALHHAAMTITPVLEDLILNGIAINTKNANNKSALELLVEATGVNVSNATQEKLIKVLLENGAELPLDAAQKKKILDFMDAHGIAVSTAEAKHTNAPRN